MTLTLMNLFIAVLTVSYSEATQRSKPRFYRHRAYKVLSSLAIKHGLSLIRCKGTPKGQSKEIGDGEDHEEEEQPMSNRGDSKGSADSKGKYHDDVSRPFESQGMWAPRQTVETPISRPSMMAINGPELVTSTAEDAKDTHSFLWVCFQSDDLMLVD